MIQMFMNTCFIRKPAPENNVFLISFSFSSLTSEPFILLIFPKEKREKRLVKH